MNEINKLDENNQLSPSEQILNAHQFLKDFLDKFENAKRGGIHDFMELTLFNMVNGAIKNIDIYLVDGHKSVKANEIMSIVIDSYQKVLDGIKRNLDEMKEVNFE